VLMLSGHVPLTYDEEENMSEATQIARPSHNWRRHAVVTTLAFACLGCFYRSGYIYRQARPLDSFLGLAEVVQAPTTTTTTTETTGWLSLGPHTVCRSDPEQTAIIPDDGLVLTAVGGKAACQKLCFGKRICTAIEYRSSEDRCEVWYGRANAHIHLVNDQTVVGDPNIDFECLLWKPPCNVLMLQQPIVKKSVIIISDFVFDKCEDSAAKSLEMCSKDYIRTTLDASETACSLRSITCGTSTCTV
jgi:hypothetical protein